MNKEIISKWDKNKNRLERFIRTNNMEDVGYKTLVSLIVEYVLNNPDDPDDWDNFDIEKIYAIDDGGYQGTLLFLIPKNMYQPSQYDYLVTYVNYGSCSGCDTLQAIQSYEYSDLPNDKQVKDYMQLCLHLTQNMKYLYEER